MNTQYRTHIALPTSIVSHTPTYFAWGHIITHANTHTYKHKHNENTIPNTHCYPSALCHTHTGTHQRIIQYHTQTFSHYNVTQPYEIIHAIWHYSRSLFTLRNPECQTNHHRWRHGGSLTRCHGAGGGVPRCLCVELVALSLRLTIAHSVCLLPVLSWSF